MKLHRYLIERNDGGGPYDRWLVTSDSGRSYGYSTRAEAEAAATYFRKADRWRREWLDKYAITYGDDPMSMSKTTGLRPHGGPVVHEATNTQPTTYESDTYCTPPEFIDSLVRPALGGVIDLDPFADPNPNRHFATDNIVYPQRDGFSERWARRTYANPPFSSEFKRLVTNKCIQERERGANTVLMLPAGVIGTEAGEMILGSADMVCFLSKRVRFLLNGKKRVAPRGGSLLALFGRDPKIQASFMAALNRLDVGVVMLRAL